jgi:hypothetical protein
MSDVGRDASGSDGSGSSARPAVVETSRCDLRRHRRHLPAATREPIAEPDVGTTPARRLRDALEPIATQGWWSRPAGERLTALGVDFFPGYVWGRAAALGTPTAAVVAATFGVFDQDLIAAVYESGSAAVSRDDILDARADGGTAGVASVATEAECAALADPLLAALDSLDALGRPLFGGLRALPVPSSGAGRLWRAAELVREHRGDGHLAVLVGAGLGAVEANVLTELWLGFGLGEYSGTRGFGRRHSPVPSSVSRPEVGWREANSPSSAVTLARRSKRPRTRARMR